MELNGFYDEEELAEMLDRKEITRKEYITHHSAELLKQYEEFCSDFGLEQNEESAEQFMEEMHRLPPSRGRWQSFLWILTKRSPMNVSVKFELIQKA